MSGRTFDPLFIFATMRARTSVMSGETAGFILTSLERANRKKRGQEMDEEAAKTFQQGMIDKYNREAHPFYMEARLFNDGTLPLKDCRDALALGFEVAMLQPIKESNFGNFKF